MSKAEAVIKKYTHHTDLNGKFVELGIHKYTRHCFHENLWNDHPEAITSRGHVYQSLAGGSEKLIHAPLHKCFNYGENGTGLDLPLDTEVSVFTKYNGYMMSVTYNDDIGYIYGTTGNFVLNDEVTNNWFLNMGRFMLKKYDYLQMARRYPTRTFVFEVCSELDPHIVQEAKELYLLGSTYLDTMKWRPLGMETVMTIADVLENAKCSTREGFMVYDKRCENLLFKIKTPHYLAKKWLMRRNERFIFDTNYKKFVDEEYYPIIDYIHKHWDKEMWAKIDEQVKGRIFDNLFKIKDKLSGEFYESN